MSSFKNILSSAGHSLPQMASIGKSDRTAQAKVTAKSNGIPPSEEAAVLHVEGSSKVIKIRNDGVEEEFTEVIPKETSQEKSANEEVSALNLPAAIEGGNMPRKGKRQRKSNAKYDDGDVSPATITAIAESENKNPVIKKSKKRSLKGPVTAVDDESGLTAQENIPPAADPASTDVLDLQPDMVVEPLPPGAHIPRCVVIKPNEIPTDDQLQKWYIANVGYDNLHPIKRAEGDLLWAKVPSHPYWPCMVSKCPFSQLFTRIKGDVRVVRCYHVQFFGDEVERGWINDPAFLPFEGKPSFLETAEVELAKLGKKTTYSPFRINPNRQVAWDNAVAEAEESMPLSIEDRKAQYTFDYVHLEDLKEMKKAERMGQKLKKVEDAKKVTTPKIVLGKKRKMSDIASSPDVKAAKRRKSEKDESTPTLQPAEDGVQKKSSKKKHRTPDTPPKKHGVLPMTHLVTSLLPETSQPETDQPDSKRGRKPSAKLLQMLTGEEAVSPSQSTVSMFKKPDLVSTPAHDAQQVEEKDGAATDGASDGAVSCESMDTSENIQPTESAVTPKPKTPVSQKKKGSSAKKVDSSSGVRQSKIGDFFQSPPKQLDGIEKENKDTIVPPEPLVSPKEETPVSSVKKKGRPNKEETSASVSEPEASKNNAPKTDSTPKVNGTSKSDSTPKVNSKSKADSTPKGNSKSKADSTPKGNSKSKADSTPKLNNKSKTDSTPKVESETADVAADVSDAVNGSNEVKKTKKAKEEEEDYELEIFKLVSTSRIDKETICAICLESDNASVKCTGSCLKNFHLKCIGLDALPKEGYKCPECTSGLHTCFICKQADDKTKKCSVASCGMYYHEDCVRQMRLTRWESKGFICPLHICSTCTVDNTKNPKATKGQLFKCVKCPTAYHQGDFCIAAGSVHLGGCYIICSNHFMPKKGVSMHTHVNINWCFICSKGGSLVCCEGCPASFHAECAKVTPTETEGRWYCEECEAGARPLYGNIVWIKVGIYRWWPGEICHPRNVPLNIQQRPHQVGEFPVRFFGSHDYYWLHHGRVFLFQEGDQGTKFSGSTSKGLSKYYIKGVLEATEAFKEWTALQSKKEEVEQEKSDKKPAPYKHVKTNIPIGNVKIFKADLADLSTCECNPNQDEPCVNDCLNRMMLFECHPAVCKAGDKCCNQRFQKRQYPDMGPFKCEGRGWGLRLNQDIEKGDFVGEYVGDLIDEEECKKRLKQAHEDNITNFYMLTMDKDRIIDAGPKGNYTRFMNHSCGPNVETQKWTVNGDTRVGLFALRDVKKGEELTFNYNMDSLGNEKKACACGSENCSGFLGVRPKTAAALANEKKANEKQSKEEKKKKKKKKKPEVPKKFHEDDCYRCGWGGELVLCDRGNCPKVYHLACLNLKTPPTGKWLCPWHHCDDCGRSATTKCAYCPNSFCAVHTPGNIFTVDGIFICTDHEDTLEEMGLTEHKKPITAEDVMKIKMEAEETTHYDHSSANSSSANSVSVSRPGSSASVAGESDSNYTQSKPKSKFKDVLVKQEEDNFESDNDNGLIMDLQRD